MGWFANIRKSFFSKPLFDYFCRVLPPLSETEKEALKAGNVWFEGSLFSGKPLWQDLYHYQDAQLSHEEQLFVDQQVNELCSLLDVWEIEHEKRELPKHIWQYLKKEKFFGMIIPKEYGGLGFSAIAHSTIILKIATRNISTAVSTMVPNSLGPAELIMHYGTEAQKKYYLPRLAAGEDIPCFALTGPDAGSDAGAIPDTGVVCRGKFEGKEIIGIKLNWDKRYITLAPIATVMGLAFKLFDPDHLIGDKTDLGVTLCLIPTRLPGIEIGDKHCPLNLAFPNGPTRGKNVFVPIDSIIGGAGMVGLGWKMLVESLSAGRGISLPALSTATGMLCYRTTGAYSAIRKQFKMPIGQFEGIEEGLARIAGLTYILEATRRLTASSLDMGNRPAIVTAIAKYHMTELARKVINDAMDIHGGRAIMLGPHNYLGDAYQATPVSITVEGANILTRNLMIFGQGATRCHPFVQKELQAAELRLENESEALDQFDAVLKQHVLYTLCNIGRWLKLSFSRSYVCQSHIRGQLTHYEKRLNWLSATLAFTTDVAFLVLGGSLKRKERLSARLGDVLSYLYLSSAVLKFYHQNSNDPSHLNHAKWALNYLGYHAQEALIAFYQNFPQRIIGVILKFLTFPFGRIYKANHDELDRILAQTTQHASVFRDQITQACFKGTSKSDPVRILDEALSMLEQIRPIEKKIKSAINDKKIPRTTEQEQVQIAFEKGFISQAEKLILDRFETLRQKVIAVDEFNSNMNVRRQSSCNQSQPAEIG
ncbi:MAG: acyl-CoA dehydrogenase [Gammaproteobacteria bacterium]